MTDQLTDAQPGYELEYGKLRQDLATLRESMEKVTETAFSEDGLVSATIGPRGELSDLVLDPRIYRTTDATALAAGIAATIRAATAAVTARMLALTEPMLPASTPRTDNGEVDFDAMLRLPGKDGERS